MKNAYVKPTTELVELDLEAMLAISAGGTIKVSKGRADEELSNEHRRGWGDLWVE